MTHLEMIQSPMEWPKWPYLPIKRVVKDQPWPDTALLWATVGYYSKTGPVTIFGGNLFLLPKTVEEFKATAIKTYADAAALLADGWVVD